MASSFPAPEQALDRLTRRVHDLEGRVAALEGKAAVEPPPPETLDAAAPPAAPRESGGALVPMMGKALLGLSLAYLLRALSEMHVLPLAAGVALGIVYALAWLVLAARAASSRPATAAIEAVTSVLVLLPLLWEATVRFHASPSWVTAGILVLFSAFGLGISWRNNLDAIAWITTLAGLFASAALLLVTRDLLPFACALLAIAAAVEASACFEHWVRERWIAAMTANLAVVLMTWLVTRPGGLPEGYAPLGRPEVVGVQIALLAIYLGAMMVRTLWRGFTVTGFETVQCVAAFVIATTGAVRVAQGSAEAVAAVGLFSAAAGVTCYLVSFAFLERSHKDRNFYTYGAFGLLLALFSTYLLLGGTARVALLCALAVTCLHGGRRSERMTLRWHACILLVAAAFDSGAARYFVTRFLGGVHTGAALGYEPALIAAAAALAGFWWLLRDAAPSGGARSFAALAIALAANLAWNLAAVAAALFTRECAGYCATILTAVLTALALGFALVPVRGVPEVLIAIATVKLLTQDLRQPHALAVVFSLLLYGGTLVLLPRINAKRRAAPTGAFPPP